MSDAVERDGEPGGGPAQASNRPSKRALVGLVVRVATTVVALAAAVGVVAGREWLGGSTGWGLCLVGASLILLWRPDEFQRATAELPVFRLEPVATQGRRVVGGNG